MIAVTGDFISESLVFVWLCLFSLLTWKSEQPRRPSESQSHHGVDIVEHSPLKDEVSC